jgi:hypothetical protein
VTKTKAQKNAACDTAAAYGTTKAHPNTKPRHLSNRSIASDENARGKVAATHIFETLVAKGDLQNTISVASRPSLIIVSLAVH